MAGGGMKGLTLPDHWPQTVDRFFGGAPLSDGYGMTEIIIGSRACPLGRYHVPPWKSHFFWIPPPAGSIRVRERKPGASGRSI